MHIQASNIVHFDKKLVFINSKSTYSQNRICDDNTAAECDITWARGAGEGEFENSVASVSLCVDKMFFICIMYL